MRVKTEQTRQRIVDAAYQCFWRSGFTRTSIDSIADRAKLTKRTIYSYYQSKDDLLAAVLNYHNDLAGKRLSHIGDQMPADPDGMIEILLRSAGKMGSSNTALGWAGFHQARRRTCASSWPPGPQHCPPSQGDDRNLACGATVKGESCLSGRTSSRNNASDGRLDGLNAYSRQPDIH